ncbi:hypothetical protein FRC12_001578 [Ceratobasidium sp. 428]|nr:hypothetical protein FRC12_001578 [Ceratobasidium sp. 428]
MASSSKTLDHRARNQTATPLTDNKHKAKSLTRGNPATIDNERKAEALANLDYRTTPRKARDGVTDAATVATFDPYNERTNERSGNAGATSRPSRPIKFHTTGSTHARTSNNILPTTNVPKQLEIDRFLESEMQLAIFCGPDFVENFLSVDSTRLQAALKDCEDNLEAF